MKKLKVSLPFTKAAGFYEFKFSDILRIIIALIGILLASYWAYHNYNKKGIPLGPNLEIKKIEGNPSIIGDSNHIEIYNDASESNIFNNSPVINGDSTNIKIFYNQ